MNNPKLTSLAIFLALFLSTAAYAYIPCSGTVHLQVPAGWNTVYFMDGQFSLIPDTPLNGWLTFTINQSLGAPWVNNGFTLTASTNWSNSPYISKVDFNISTGSVTANQFTCADFNNFASGDIYIFENADEPGRTIVSNEAPEFHISNSKVQLAGQEFNYTGNPIEPEVISVIHNGTELIAGTDYEISYQNNVIGSNARVMIIGKNDYEGTKILPFTIIINAMDFFAGGTGTINDPYIIETKAQLEILALFTNSGKTFQNEHIKLGNNIDLSGSEENQWTPIGNASNAFRGSFDGNGKVINGLFINNIANNQGLFGYVNGAAISNLGLENFHVQGGSNVGGIIGGGIGTNTVTNSYAIGSGGIVGSGTVRNSYFVGTETGIYYDSEANSTPKTIAEMQESSFRDLLQMYAGIFNCMGWTYNINSYPSFSNVKAAINDYFAGGAGTINDPYIIETKAQLEILTFFTNSGKTFQGEYIKLGNDIDLNGSEENQWTPIGNASNAFRGSFDGNGKVISGLFINNIANNQGLFGSAFGASISNLGLINFYVSGGANNVGGISGFGGTVINSYAIGVGIGSIVVNGTVRNSYFVGGTETRIYYDSEGRSSSKTTAEMQASDFRDILQVHAGTLNANVSNNYMGWTYNAGSYPTFSGEKAVLNPNIADYFAGGTGAINDPYIIETKTQLEILALFVNSGKTFQGEYIKLGNNIDLNGSEENRWTPIGNSWNRNFSGNFDGNGKVISGLYITTGSYQGLFGNANGATISNLGLEDFYVRGIEFVGGISGSGGTITNSYAIGSVSGVNRVGGISGSGAVTNSYFVGSVSGTSYVDGISGWGTVTHSFYNSDLTGPFAVARGTQKTTAEMQASDFRDLLQTYAGTQNGDHGSNYMGWTHNVDGYPSFSGSKAIIPNAYYLYFLPPDSKEWMVSTPYFIRNATEKEKMSVAPSHCGWYRKIFFNEVPNGDVFISSGFGEQIGPFNLAELFGEDVELFFIPSDEANSWHKTDPLIDGVCSYDLSATIYHTSPQANSSFSRHAGNGRAEGLCKGFAADKLVGDKIQWAGNHTCETDWTPENFEDAFKETPGKNVKRYYDMQFQRRPNGLWEFDASFMCRNGEVDFAGEGACQGMGGRLGGFYPPNLLQKSDAYGDYTAAYTDCDGCGAIYGGDANVVVQNEYQWCFDRGWLGTGTGNLDGLTTAAEIDTEMNQACTRQFIQGELISANYPVPYQIGGTVSDITGLFCFESAPATFVYVPGQEFFFRGDDDIWIYINNQLVIDLGGNHMPAPGYVKLDTISVPEKLVPGESYPISIFFCDRRAPGSNIRIATNMYIGQRTPLDISMLTPIPDQEYIGGREVRPQLSLKDGETLLSLSDYEVRYSDNINLGTATATVFGRGNYYTGSFTATFEIIKKTLTLSMLMPIFPIEFTGRAIEPEIFLVDAGRRLVNGTDYDVKYSDNTDPGTATFTITGKGNYTGIIIGNFEILEGIRQVEIEVVWDALTLPYTGEPQMPSATAFYGGVPIPLIISGAGTNVGIYTATARPAAENTTYTLTNTMAVFAIAKASIAATLSIADIKEGSGQILEPIVNGNRGNGAVTYLYSTEPEGTYTNEPPTTQGIYFAKAVIAETVNYLGSTTPVISFTIAKADPVLIEIVWNSPFVFEYNGAEQRPVALGRGSNDESFDVIVSGAIVAGTHIATARLAVPNVDYELVNTTREFTINPKPLNPAFIAPIGPIPKTFLQIKPDIMVRDGATALIPDVDYTVYYSQNVDFQGSVVIEGRGNYSGVAEAFFEISDPPSFYNVQVEWDSNIVLEYNGSLQAPSAVARLQGTELELEITGQRRTPGEYTAFAELKRAPELPIFLNRYRRDYEITRKALNVIWSDDSVFVYNKMDQSPRASLNPSEPGVEFLYTNRKTSVGQYRGGDGVYVQIMDQEIAPYYILRNHIKGYEIIKRDLKPHFSTRLPAFEYNTDTLWVPSEAFTDYDALTKILESIIAYDVFATNTETNESDNISALRGEPRIELEYAACTGVACYAPAARSPPQAPAARSSPSLLSRRVETTQKATAIIITDNVSADNYALIRQTITIIEMEDDNVETIFCNRSGYCTELSEEVCLFVGGTAATGSCDIARTSCLIDADRCVANMLLRSCVNIGGTPSETCGATPIIPIIPNPENPKIGAIGVQTIYYNLKGTPLGAIKPATPGIYIEKTGKLIRKIIVK
jgi:fibro-slime domain-containing protein